LSWVLAGVMAVYVFSDKNNGMNLEGYLWQKKVKRRKQSIAIILLSQIYCSCCCFWEFSPWFASWQFP